MAGHLFRSYLEGAFQKLRLPGSLCSLREYKWQALLKSWRRPTGQQDAAEFLGHLLLRSQPGAFHGSWAAKMIVGPSTCRRLDVVDGGPLASPIILDATAGDLRSGLLEWQQQYSVHALQEPSAFLVIQLQRFAQTGNTYCKITNECRIQAGELVDVPVFSSGLRLTSASYCVRAVLYHLGSTPYSGHYRTALCVATTSMGSRRWDFHVTDDGIPTKLATGSDVREIQANCYLCFLSKNGPVHE